MGPGPGGGVVDGRLRRQPEPGFSLRQHRQPLAIGVLRKPRLTGEQPSRPVVAAGVELGLGTGQDEARVQVQLARRGREQGFGGVPGAAGEPQRLGLLSRHHRRGLLCRDRERRHRADREQGRESLHCARRTRERTRWYSARDIGVSRNRPKPV